MSNLLRVAVSKQKRRYQKNGYDLDLAYITDNIIAMGFPSEKVEGVFRNPMKDVQRFLDQYHKDHFKVYNLCSERVYDHSKFYGRVGYYPFDDHNAPQFELIDAFCRDVDAWMKEDSKNIAVIHCKAGKGRTGLMICCWLMYCGMWKNTEDSLRFYAALRTYNQKGVTIPSQIRYVGYFGRSIRESIKYVPRNVTLKKIVLRPLPKEINLSEVQFNISVGKNCVFNSKEQNMNVVISKKKKTVVDKNKKDPKKKLTKENSEKNIVDSQQSQSSLSQSQQGQSSPNMQSLSASGTISSGSNVGTVNGNTLHQLGGSQFSLSDLADSNGNIGNDEYISFEIGSLPLAGDIRIEFTNKQDDRMFMFWINTSFVQQLEIIPKSGLDKAHKDKNHKAFPEDFHVELTFDQVEQQSHTTVVASAEEQTNNQHYPQSSNNVATSSSHHDNITVVASDAPQNNNNNNNNLNSSNSNNATTTTSKNNISLASSQSNPVQQETTPSTTTTTSQISEENSTPKVEAEKIENSNASANDSETSSNSSS
ncbi:hypothetical protein ACTFIU_003182 [Dictyostelium citrinum]